MPLTENGKGRELRLRRRIVLVRKRNEIAHNTHDPLCKKAGGSREDVEAEV